MSKCDAPTIAFHTPTPPRKTRQSAGLSFDELTSIDFVSLLDQHPSSGLSAAHDDDAETASAVSDMPSTHRPDNPLTWSFDAPFLSIAEAAVWLHVSLATLKRLLLKGSLPFVRVGARRKIPFSALRAYVICARAGCVLPPASPPRKSERYD
jgi:excisionase family DNA binding protein